MRPQRGDLPLGPLAGTRYPDPRIEKLDKRFPKQGNAGIDRIATGFRWAEGPVYFRDGGYLVWSDIPNNRMMRWLEEDGHVSVFRHHSNYSNGNTRDREGRLLTCEHDARRVTRTELDGRITVVMDSFNGKKLNAPNDIVVTSDGAIWFTDPGYGIDGEYEGHADKFELGTNVYRIDPKTGRASVVVDDFTRPNGLAFSPDEKLLYIVDSGATHGGPAHIRVFDVVANKLRKSRVFADDFSPGFTDGMRVDVKGNVWCSMGWADPLRRRRALLRSRRRYDRQGASAGDLRQPLLRRQEAQPAVHVRQHLDLCALCGYPGRAASVARAKPQPHRGTEKRSCR